MTRVWAMLAQLFGIVPDEYIGYVDELSFSEMVRFFGQMTVGSFLALFFYMILCFCVILSVFRLIEYIADILIGGRFIR